MTLHLETSLDDFLIRPEGKPYEEYLHGEVTAKKMPSFPHSLTQVELGRRLANWADEAGGYVLSEQRCVLRTAAGSQVLLPDVSYFPQDCFAQQPTGAVTVPPLLAVEILSPDDVYGLVQEKVFTYLSAGVQIVWVVDPVARNVTIYRPGATPELTFQHLADRLLPGFHLSLQSLFAKLAPQ